MYPYLKELTSNEAYAIQQSNPDCLAYYPKSTNHPNHVSTVGHFIFQGIYGELNHSVFITALDYATHILKQKTPPEGWGYAAYNEPERYKGLPKLDIYLSGWLPDGKDFDGNWNGWYYYAFRLSDLARVEAEKVELTTRQAQYLTENNSPIQKEFYHGIYYISKADYDSMPNEFKELAGKVEGTDTDKTEINAEQVEDEGKTVLNYDQIEWLRLNKRETTHFQNGVTRAAFVSYDTVLHQRGTIYEILTSTYNALPQEFKDLAAPIPPSGIRPPVNPFTDEDLAEFIKDDNESKPQYWIDKYKELEREKNGLVSNYANLQLDKQRNEKDLQKQIADLEAKNKELANRFNAQAQEAGNLFLDATQRATLEGRIAELEAKYNEIVKAAKYAIDKQQFEQKMLDSYADAKCKAEIAVYQFNHLINK